MEYVIKLRGCPWSTTEEDVIEFFGADVQILGDRDGIHLVRTNEGRATGECFVEPLTARDLELALTKDHRNMGHRYIEVFQVKKVEMDWILKRARPNESTGGNNGSSGGSGYRGSGGSGYGDGVMNESETYVRLRGLPYECSEDDIEQFFSGLDVATNGIHMVMDGAGGKFSGEAYCQFTSREGALEALSRDRQCIGHRYVELFRVTNAELRNSLDQSVHRNNRSYAYNRAGPYDRRDTRPGMGRSGGMAGRSGGSAMTNRFVSRNPNTGNGGDRFGGGGQDTWNKFAKSEVGSWDRGGGMGGGGSSRPQPLLPGLKAGGGGGGNGRMMTMGSGEYPVLMRGLPWSATESDIGNFFSPINIRGVQIIFDETDRPSGSARAFFASADDQACALRKHKHLMGSRYVELFVE